MNKIENIVYNLLGNNQKIKFIVRNVYQGFYDLMPRKHNFCKYPISSVNNSFFGFHDVTPFSADNTKILAIKNSFDFRMHLPGETVDVGYYKFENGIIGDFVKISQSSAWNYHKGCRLQWFDDKHIIFNTAQDNKAVSKIINIENGEVKNLSLPIDSVYNAAGKSLLTSFSYERLQRCMSGYGYPYSDESFLNECAPSQTGLFIYDINTQSKRLLVSLKELAKYDDEDSVSDYLNFVTHTQFRRPFYMFFV